MIDEPLPDQLENLMALALAAFVRAGFVIGPERAFGPHFLATTLSLGKGMAGPTAQSKGRRLGISKPKATKVREKPKRGEEFFVDLCGRPVPAVQTDEGVRAVAIDRPIKPEPAGAYLKRSFAADLNRVREAMKALAKSIRSSELEQMCFGLYEQFRPSIPAVSVDGARRASLI